MAEKKKILENAILDINHIKNALNENTKEILRSVAKEEIDSIVKESLTTEIYDEEDVESDDIESTDDVENIDDETASTDSEDVETDFNSEESDDDSEDSMDTLDVLDDELDMTSASDDEIIAIYKKMGNDDEIEIVDDELHLNIDEPGEYIVKLDGIETASEDVDSESEDTDDDSEVFDGEEPEYEIELDDSDYSDETTDNETFSDDEESSDEELTDIEDNGEDDEEKESIDEKISVGTGMSVGTHRNQSGAGSVTKLSNPKKVNETAKYKTIASNVTKKYNSLLNEVVNLKNENDEYRLALKEFRTNLVKSVVFNSNLTYATKLFVEHSTTKAEKEEILKKFDEVKTIKESKNLYKLIESDLNKKQPITESIDNKIMKDVSTSTSRLTESTVYVDATTQRIKDLINRVERK